MLTFYHQTGYSVARSLSEAPKYASVIATILKPDHNKAIRSSQISNENISMLGKRWFGMFGIVLCVVQTKITTILARTMCCEPHIHFRHIPCHDI